MVRVRRVHVSCEHATRNHTTPAADDTIMNTGGQGEAEGSPVLDTTRRKPASDDAETGKQLDIAEMQRRSKGRINNTNHYETVDAK